MGDKRTVFLRREVAAQGVFQQLLSFLPDVRTARPAAQLYMGAYWHLENKYGQRQQGPDGRFDEYVGGWIEILSAPLAHAIAVDNRVDSVLFEPYGQTGEDCTLGKWVKRAVKTHGFPVDYVQCKMLIIQISRI